MKRRVTIAALHEIIRTNKGITIVVKVAKGSFLLQDWDTMEMILDGWYREDRRISAIIQTTEKQIIILSFKEHISKKV